MARITFKKGDEWALRLGRLGAASPDIAKKAVFAGASIVADAIRSNLNKIPTEGFRRLKDGEQLNSLSATQKQDLIDSFGVTPINTDRDGIINAHIGFDGYGSKPSKKYPKGLPNQLLARAVESGSSVRVKNPFVRPAVNATRKRAVDAMAAVVDEATQEIMK